MAISRPLLLALLGALLFGVTVVAVQSARTGVESDSTPGVVQSEPAAAPEQAPVAGPEETLRAAFNFSDLNSATFDARLRFGSRGESVDLHAAGAFQRGAANDVPEFEVRLSIVAGGERLAGGFISLGDRAYFARGNTGWRVPAAVWDPLVESAGQGGAQRQLPFEVHPETWMRDVKSEGRETVGGVETEHVSVVVDPKAVAKDLSRVAGQNGAQLPSPAALARAVRSADLDVWIGADDRIMRRISGEIAFARGGRLEVDLTLTDVNEPHRFEAPARVVAGAPAGAFGRLAEGIVGGINGVTGAEPTSLAALTSRSPQRAARAVHAHKKVVILFRNPRGLDDRAMAPVMRALDRRTRALVLTDHVDAVERYGSLVEDLGVSQTPSVVIIDRSGQARLMEGFVDSDTLAQAVADAR